MAITYVDIPGFVSSSDSNINVLDYQWSEVIYSPSGLNPNVPFIKGDDLLLQQSDTILYEDNNWKLYTIVIQHNPTTVGIRLVLYDKVNSANVFYSSIYQAGQPGIDFFGLIFAIDDNLELAQVFQAYYYRLTDDRTFYAYINASLSLTSNASAKTYLFLKQIPLPIIYTWQSVPSITGKGKTIQLSTLNDINDGEEVITDDTSKFNLTTASNALTLIRNNLPN